MIDSGISKILLSEQEINERVKALAKEICRDYENKNLLLVSLLKGSVIFLSDLMRELTIDCAIDFMCVSSYASGTKTSGTVKIIKDLDIDISDSDVLLVEDILDSGLTLNYIIDILRPRNPKSIKICALLDKAERRQAPIELDYCGFKIPNEFVVGYGLDYDEKYRNLPYVAVLSPSVYEG